MPALIVMPTSKAPDAKVVQTAVQPLHESPRQLVCHVTIEPASNSWRRHVHKELHIVLEQGTVIVTLKKDKESPAIAHLLSSDGGRQNKQTIPLGMWYLLQPQGVLPLRFTLTQTGSYLGADDVQVTKDFEDL